MKLDKRHWIFLAFALVVFIIDIKFFLKTPYFIPIIVVIVTLGTMQFWNDYFRRQSEATEIEERFPDFVRNLVGAIKSGMPAPQAIVHVSNTDYGALTKHIKKLANQLEWSIPLHKAMLMFANETQNPVIIRAISTVIEAELAGGNIEDVLESITNSVVQIKKIRQKRKATIHSQIIQSYVIFFVFLGIMVVIQNLMIPYMSGVSSNNINEEGIAFATGGAGITGVTKAVKVDFTSVAGFSSTFAEWVGSMNGIFLMLAVIQGFFAGLVIGKLAEGKVSAGMKHSLILVTIGVFVMTLAQGFV